MPAGPSRPFIPKADLGPGEKQPVAQHDPLADILNSINGGRPDTTTPGQSASAPPPAPAPVAPPKPTQLVWNPNWGPAPQSVSDEDRQKAQGIYGPYGPPNSFGQYQGQDRLMARMAKPPGYASKPYSHDWDQWLLTLPFDARDQQYNDALRSERQGAIDRERKRGQDMSHVSSGPFYNNIPPSRDDAMRIGAKPQRPNTATDFGGNFTGDNATQEANDLVKQRKADKYAQGPGKDLENTPIALNAYGDQVDPKKILDLPGGRKPTVGTSMTNGLVMSQGTDDNGDTVETPGAVSVKGPIDIKTLYSSGKVVYAGSVTHKGPYGVETQQAQFMSVNDAELIPARWDAQTVANFQHAMKQKVTGYVDSATLTSWNKIVAASNYYTQAGMPISVSDILNIAVKGGLGGGGGSGGGGGRKGGGGGGAGGGGSAVSSSQARGYLNQAMRQYVGREANDAEAAAFARDINAVASHDPNFSPQQWTADWIKSRVPGQVGSFQAATDYYSAMMSVLNGGVP